MYFIDVLLPIPLRQTFTYNVNKDEAAFLKKGMRVAVPFGKTKIYTGIVVQIHSQAPPNYETKSIDQILDEFPIVNEIQLKHWQWMAGYYMCTQGEVMRAALPNAFLLESDTIVSLMSKDPIDESVLSDEEFLVYEALLHQSSLHINDIRSILDRSNVVLTIKKLLERNVIRVEEEMQEKYTPKLIRYIKLTSTYTSEENLRELLENLSRAPKQKQLLLSLFTLSANQKKPIDSIQLQKKSGTNASVLRALIDKGILEEHFIQKDRVDYKGGETSNIKELSPAQLEAFQQIKENFKNYDTTVLHGVTSSGKTEVYVRFIEELITSGKQVLYMLPEIALTAQLITRLQKYFGDKVAIYHSKYSVNERVEVWKNVLEQKAKAQIVLGARSSLFLPFSNLGLIIVDEEHEATFKQYNPAPRYHGRDSAIVLAKLHSAKVILGSATPSLETYYNAKEEKYGFVELAERYGKVLMPEIELVDIQEKRRKKQMNGNFSDRLLEEMNLALENEEQIILFQNRRGYSPIVECTTCGTSPQCPNCDVSLTYHQYKNELRCHYCGHHIAMLISCLACNSDTMDTKGFGTQQIEEEVKEIFPNHTVARMDQDTTRKKHGYEKIIEALEEHQIDILVGTQMLAKGLDFKKVSLVGVMNADNLLNFPDFRAHERSFQMLQQVSGRAGRDKKRGKVIIQTYNPFHQILQQVSTNSYEEMFAQQQEDRYQFKYPPFFRILKITFKDRNFMKMQKASLWYAQALRGTLEEHVLGPEVPPVGRIRNQFITHVLVKIPKQQSLAKTKLFILKIDRTFNSIKEFSSVRSILDVDNY